MLNPAKILFILFVDVSSYQVKNGAPCTHCNLNYLHAGL